MNGRLFGRALIAPLIAVQAPSFANPVAPPSLSAYGSLPAIEHVALSPSGNALAIASTIKGERRVIAVDAAKKVSIDATLGDVKLRDLDWAGDGLLLATTSSTQSLGAEFTADKYEFYGTQILKPGDPKPELMFSRSQGVGTLNMGYYGTREIGGRWFGFVGGVAVDVDKGGTHFVSGNPTLYKVDLADNSARPLADRASGRQWRSWLIGIDGQVVATAEMSRDTGKWSISGAGGVRIASGTDITGGFAMQCLGQNGTSAVYAIEDDDAGRIRWFEVPLAGGVQTELFAGAAVDRLFVDKTNGRLLGYLERGQPRKPHLFDQAKQAAAASIFRSFGKLNPSIEDWTPDFSKALVHTSGNGDSGTWYLVDAAHRSADPVGYDRPSIGPEQVGPISSVAYTASDGLPLNGILTLPPGREAKNLPVVLLPHDGPAQRDDTMFDWWAQALAARGYAVFQPNFRGSTDNDEAFRRASYGQWGRKMQSDISDGLAELAKKGIADPKRACIVGIGYGGYAALAGVTLQHGLYRCAIAVAALSDLELFSRNRDVEHDHTKMGWRSLREWLGEPSTYASVSPRRHAADADAPIMLIHGRDDTAAPFEQSEVMAGALRAAGKPVEFVTLEHEDHRLSHSATRIQMLEAAVGFVMKHNPAD